MAPDMEPLYTFGVAQFQVYPALPHLLPLLCRCCAEEMMWCSISLLEYQMRQLLLFWKKIEFNESNIIEHLNAFILNNNYVFSIGFVELLD